MDVSPSPTVHPTTLAPGITTRGLIQDKKKRNIVIGSVLGGLVLICVAAALIYIFVFRKRVYYGNHVLVTSIQTPMAPDKDSKVMKPTGPPARYTLAPGNKGNNSVAEMIMNNSTSCMLVTTSLDRKGLVNQGDTCLIWEPLSNMYLFLNTCSEYKDEASCDNAQMGFPLNTCMSTMTTDTPQKFSACVPKPANMAQLVFRALPNDFAKLVKDPSGANTYIKGFMFNFVGTEAENKCPTTPGTKLTCNAVKKMLTIHTNYVLKSNLTGSYIVDDMETATLHNTGQAYSALLNWQLMK